MPQTYYDEIAEGYDELHGEEQLRKIKFIASSVESGPDDRLLDVGCGSGIAFDFFPCRYVGLDPSFELLKKVDGSAVQGIAESLPFQDDSFDIIISVSAIHNFDSPEKAVEEMKRVGKDRFVITLFKKGKDKGKRDSIMELLQDEFNVQMLIEDDHDHIFFCTHPTK